ALDALHAQALQLRVAAAREAAHLMSFGQQGAHHRAAQETAAAGDQRLHLSFSSAHTASFSRKILALWRMSQGKAGWNRTVEMGFVWGWAAPSASSSCSIFFGSPPFSSSTHRTGTRRSFGPVPTKAVRFTSGCLLNTPSHGMV